MSSVTAAPLLPPDKTALTSAKKRMETALARAAGVVRGQETTQRLVAACLLARGHVLLDDVPGVGKTTLAKTLARAFGLKSSRIQFTSDMLPGDILGMQVPSPDAPGTLIFRPGPLVAELVVADEINRASPRTQSALLEAMAERRITYDDVTVDLPERFCVLATQNPLEHRGTFPLPESQLDRFMVTLTLGYPDPATELALIENPEGPENALAQLRPELLALDLATLSAGAQNVLVAPPVAAYLLAIVRRTREHPDVVLGASPRAALALTALARAWALLSGRDFVLPDDVKFVVPFALAHRLALAGAVSAGSRPQAQSILEQILRTESVPR